MIYAEALEKVKSDPNIAYIAFFMRGDSYLGFYEIKQNAEEDDWIDINFEGGIFFSSSGEEDSYDQVTVPEEAKALKYAPSEAYPGFGWTAEHIASQLFQDGPDPEEVWTSKDRAEFARAVKARMQKQWTVLD